MCRSRHHIVLIEYFLFLNGVTCFVRYMLECKILESYISILVLFKSSLCYSFDAI